MTWLSIPLEGFAAAAALILAGIVTMVFVTLGVLFRTRRNVRVSMARKGRKRYVQQTEIDGFGVHVTVEGERAKVGFEKLRLVRETKDAFYLFLTESEAWILPKEQMEDRDTECAAIRAIFTRVIEPRRLRLLK